MPQAGGRAVKLHDPPPCASDMGKMQTPVHGNEGAPLDTGTARLHACEHDNSATAPVLLQKSPADLDYFSAEQGCPETPEMAPLRGKSPAPAGAAISGETKSVARALTPEISSLGLASKWRGPLGRSTSSWPSKRASSPFVGLGRYSSPEADARGDAVQDTAEAARIVWRAVSGAVACHQDPCCDLWS